MEASEIWARAIIDVPHARKDFGSLRGACEVTASDLCYDLTERRIVYRPMRQYMPTFEGFTAENVSLRRNGIRVRYSFR